MRDILRNSELRILATAETISGVGSWITMMAVIALVVFRDGGGVAESGGIMLAGLGPYLLASPLAGALADRYDRKSLMIASQLLAGLTVVGLMSVDSLAATYALLAAGAAAGAIMMPARQSAVPSLVSEAQLTQANAFLQQLASFVKIFAPMLAGGVLVVMAPRHAMAFDVVSYVVAAAILTRLPSLPPAREEGAGAPAQGDAAAPPVHLSVPAAVRANPELLLLFGMGFAAVFVIMGFDVLSSIMTRDILGGGEQLLGGLISLVGAGSVAGSLYLMSHKGRDPWRGAIVGLVLLAAIPGGAAVAGMVVTSPWVARSVVAVVAFLGGFGSAMINVQAATLLQTEAPRVMLGRLSGLLQTTLVAGQLICVLTTPLYVPSLISVATYFALSAAALVLLAAATAVGVARIRRPAVPRGRPCDGVPAPEAG